MLQTVQFRGVMLQTVPYRGVILQTVQYIGVILQTVQYRGVIMQTVQYRDVGFLGRNSFTQEEPRLVMGQRHRHKHRDTEHTIEATSYRKYRTQDGGHVIQETQTFEWRPHNTGKMDFIIGTTTNMKHILQEAHRIIQEIQTTG